MFPSSCAPSRKRARGCESSCPVGKKRTSIQALWRWSRETRSFSKFEVDAFAAKFTPQAQASLGPWLVWGEGGQVALKVGGKTYRIRGLRLAEGRLRAALTDEAVIEARRDEGAGCG